MHGQPDETKKYPFYHCPYCGKNKSNRKVEKALRGLLEAVPIGTEAIRRTLGENLVVEQGAAVARAAAIGQRMEKLQERRRRLTLLYADGELTTRDYQAAIGETDGELAGLQGEQAGLEGQQAGEYDLGRTARWLEGLTSWADLLDGATIAEKNGIYRRCLAGCVLDIAGGRLTVRWTPAIRYLVGEGEQTVGV